jgi:hypothetical protein
MFMKPMTAPNGASTECHVVHDLTARSVGGGTNVLATVRSYASKRAWLAGEALVFELPVNVPFSALTTDLWKSVEAWITTHADSPFVGGVVATVPTTPLDLAKYRKLAEVEAVAQRLMGRVDFAQTAAAFNAATKVIRDEAVRLRNLVNAAATEEAVNAIAWA